MRRGRGSAIIPILIIILILGAVAIATVKVYNKLNIYGNWLTEEFVPENVVVRGVFSVDYGKVYEVVASKEGWKIQEADKAIYEKIVLQDVGLSQNDVIIPHIFDLFFDGQDDYIQGDLVNPIPFSINDPYGTLLTRGNVLSNAKEGSFQNANVLFRVNGGRLYYGDTTDPHGSARKFGFNFRGLSHYSAYGPYDFGIWKDLAGTFHVIDANHTEAHLYIDGQDVASGTYERQNNPYATDETNQVFAIGSSSNGDYVLHGFVCYAIYFSSMLSGPDIQQVQQDHIVDSQDLEFFIDPALFNSTHYIDIITGAAGTPYGDVTRVPAERTWLWLVKSLESDNKVHFMWFPRGSIIRIKDSSGNIIRQFVIDGTPINDNGQIEDYAIDLPSLSIPQASVEAWIPSMKIRVYAPPSAKVEIVKDNVIYGSGIVGASGYVDITLTQKLDNAEIWICAEKSDKNLKIDIKEDGDNLVVAVLDENNILVPNALVMVKDAAGVVIAYATTDDSGQVIFSKSELLSGLFSKELTFSAKAIWNSKYYTSKEVSYTLVSEHVGTEIGEHLAENKERYILYGLGFLAIVLFITILTRTRARRR